MKSKLLCGVCEKPLTPGISSRLVDVVGAVYQERTGYMCTNSLCDNSALIIEVTQWPLRTRLAARWSWLGWLLPPRRPVINADCR